MQFKVTRKEKETEGKATELSNRAIEARQAEPLVVRLPAALPALIIIKDIIKRRNAGTGQERGGIIPHHITARPQGIITVMARLHTAHGVQYFIIITVSGIITIIAVLTTGIGTDGAGITTVLSVTGFIKTDFLTACSGIISGEQLTHRPNLKSATSF